MEIDISNSPQKKVDSRRSGQRNNGLMGELPQMTTLSHNTNNSFKETNSMHNKTGNQVSNYQPQQMMMINSMQNSASSRMPKGQNFALAQRSQNFDSENSATNRHIQGVNSAAGQAVSILSPQSTTVGSKPNFMLPQTMQLPQKEFVMMDVGVKGPNRKGGRNNKGPGS